MVHYLIHSYDAPGLAQNALEAARRYAALALPLRLMPFICPPIYLRDWECGMNVYSQIRRPHHRHNVAEQAGIKGHWDEELHALDYMMYGYRNRATT